MTDDEYFDSICLWISSKFGGYSINHVAGRFKTGDKLLTLLEAAQLQGNGARYLIDETTAIVKFIFPCGNPIKKEIPNLLQYFGDNSGAASKSLEEDAKRIRFLFNTLFVRVILEIIDGQDEIWMLESGLENRLHIWRVDESAN